MIEHIVLFNVKPETSQGKVDELIRKTKTTLSKIPTVKDLWISKSLKPDARYRYTFAMRFTDEKALQEYLDHPDHRRYAKEALIPLTSEIVSFDYELV